MKNKQLGLSDGVWLSEGIQNYNLPFGWLGHSQRTAELDRLIEAGLTLRGVKREDMWNWFTSTGGRHFGDSLEGLSKLEKVAEVLSNLDGIYNLILIYSHPEHKGDLASTIWIKAYLTSQGLLL